MKKMIPFVILLGAIVLVISYRFSNREPQIKDTVYLKISSKDDYYKMMMEVRLLPQKKVNHIECFRITQIEDGSRFKETQLNKEDCLVSVKSYQKGSKTGFTDLESKVILNSETNLRKLFMTLRTPQKVELEFLRNNLRHYRTYEIEYVD